MNKLVLATLTIGAALIFGTAAAAAAVSAAASPSPRRLCSTLLDAPSDAEASKLNLLASLVLKLNQTPSVVLACGLSSHPEADDTPTTTTTQSAEESLPLRPLHNPTPGATSTASSSSSSSSSHELLTTLAIAMLVHNLLPQRLSHRWALVTTAAAWLWLAFERLSPWLPQTTPPSHTTTAQTGASGAGDVAAAAGLSSAATAAGAVGGVGGDPRTRWWQHALLFLELFTSNAVDALLLMGLLLLPLLALRRWWAGKRMWGHIAGLSSAPSSPMSADGGGAATPGASDSTTTTRPQRAFRSSFDGVSAQLQSAGHTAARLAKAMRSVGSNVSRHRRTSRNSNSPTRSSSSSRASSPRAAVTAPGAHAGVAGSRGTSASSSTGSMVSPEQSILQPTTPPLLYVARSDHPLAAPPMHVPPTTREIAAGRDAAARAAADVADDSTRSMLLPKASSSGNISDSSATTTTTTTSSVIEPRRPAHPETTPATDSDSGRSQGPPAGAAPAGSRSGSGSSAAGVGGASLNLGAVGTIRTVSARGPTQPMYPTRALYTSPLETVVVSCKLGSNNSSSSTTMQVGGTAAYAGPSTTAHGMMPPSAAGTSGSPTHRIQVPLSPAQASLAAGAHAGSSVTAQRELREVVEAAVRQAVAASNVSVLSTNVTSFPGCVHVVATAHLTPGVLEAVAAAAGDDATTTADGAATSADSTESQIAQVVWEHVVQQIMTAQTDSSSSTPGASSPGPASDSNSTGVLVRQGLFLKHLLVQDGAGNVKYLYLSPAAASEFDSTASVRSVSPVGSQMWQPDFSPAPSSISSPSTYHFASSSNNAGVVQQSVQQQLYAAASTIRLSRFAVSADDAPGASAASKLTLLLPQLAGALTAAHAGLRLVLSGNPREEPAAPAGDPAHSTSSSGTSGSLLVDHSLWPGSSSWPSGREFDLLQLLPPDAPVSQLAQRFGPVLTLNIVASTARQQTTASAAASAAPSAATASAGDDTAASIVHSTLAARAVPDASPVQDQQTHDAASAGRSASASVQLHQDIASLLARLGAGSTSPVGAGAGAAPAAEAALVSATAAGEVSGAQQQHQQGSSPLGEHLLLQLPLLLLPAAACSELDLLQERMAEELGGDDETAATAAAVHSMHMLPFIHDVAAALSMRQEGCVQGEVQHMLSTEQKHMLKQLLQFMSDQSMDTLAATVCSHLGATDSTQLLPSAQDSNTGWQHDGSARIAASLAAPAQHSMALMGEIQPEEDEEEEAAASAHTALMRPAEAVQGAEGPRSSTSSATSSSLTAHTAESTVSTPLSAAAATSDAGDSHVHTHSHSKHAAKVMQQATAAHEQAVAAQRAAEATESALKLALAQISALTSAAAQASRQAADAQAAAAAATQRAAAVEEQSERQRAMQLITSPAGAPAAGARGVGIWGILSSSSRAVAAARESGSALLGGVMHAAEPPLLPQDVAPRDVLLGFEDERLEVQYRRLKALQARGIDRAAFVMQLVRQVVYVWRIARLMYVSAGTGLSLVLLCKYEAVLLLPYVMMILTPEFYLYHRHLLLCLSQIAAALTVGMIATTEVYRNEWSALLAHPGPTLLARPSMMLAWYYVLVPLLQQQTLPEQALSCLAQLAHSLLIYLFILKGSSATLWLVVPLLLAASGVSFGVTYVADAWSRKQAVAGARRSLMGGAGG